MINHSLILLGYFAGCKLVKSKGLKLMKMINPLLIIHFLLLLVSLNVNSSDTGAPQPPNIVDSKKLNKLSDLLFNLEQDDLLLLDIDNTLLSPGKKKYQDPVKSVDDTIGQTIKQLQSKGVIVLGLTARSATKADQTDEQLKTINVDLKNSIDVVSIDPKYFENRVKNNLPGQHLFKNGVIYASHPKDIESVKGEVLVAFLDFFKLTNEHKKLSSQQSQTPNTRVLDSSKIKRIAFVDDMETNNLSV